MNSLSWNAVAPVDVTFPKLQPCVCLHGLAPTSLSASPGFSPCLTSPFTLPHISSHPASHRLSPCLTSPLTLPHISSHPASHLSTPHFACHPASHRLSPCLTSPVTLPHIACHLASPVLPPRPVHDTTFLPVVFSASHGLCPAGLL
ncbi:hypothetical protein Pcinc_017286 [Petrolisthes cinctipes]|uniref:Uncharacterized protein n=1 Tax=Petrolisthes cinctipes TaxID=88211 RepID=A0AAE1FQH9_PETCI|nr:hypothetical protein Pcinc_017286 [Petrolisthes cinctipes]